eukprot:CAMPEP_0194043060 /NCGR_PEP_ID=MMETSP0009_2-20130614/14751_1 /TAXON_ID=210454 /ORGANISM="Grammatophora oceanica, Strain CCMP 410" /LENGTH=52 /DNA_ID=CAMNT_0038687143 /DNA_START=5 /DNA_END=160 /DNA_ORIENTATION=-
MTKGIKCNILFDIHVVCTMNDNTALIGFTNHVPLHDRSGVVSAEMEMNGITA